MTSEWISEVGEGKRGTDISELRSKIIITQRVLGGWV